jgi:hypothetical protein
VCCIGRGRGEEREWERKRGKVRVRGVRGEEGKRGRGGSLHLEPEKVAGAVGGNLGDARGLTYEVRKGMLPGAL